MRTVPAGRSIVFLLIASIGTALDLWTKSYFFGRLGMPTGRPWWVWEDVFGFETSLNEGALFGFGQGGVAVFVTLSIVAAIGIAAWYLLPLLRPASIPARDWLITVALALVLGGILGNLYDRLGLHGLRWHYTSELHALGDPVYAVRDWVKVMIGRWPWPNFNIADSLLVSGACLLALHAFRQESASRKTPEPEAE